jgi:nudix-type nucleoside diphosphatase (YffH/AdpP family)
MPRFIEMTCVYDGWFRLSRARLRLDDGQVIERHIEDHGRAVTVLPYDAQRRTAMFVRQLRAPVLLADQPDLLEAVAGQLDCESPLDCARREAMEEAGVRIDRLEHVATVWSMPTLSTERIDLYLAPYAETDRVEQGGGLAEECENITVVELGLAEAWRMFQRGELSDMKTIVLLQALKLSQPNLFVER